MRIVISSPLKHRSAEELAVQQAEQGCSAVVFHYCMNDMSEQVK